MVICNIIHIFCVVRYYPSGPAVPCGAVRTMRRVGAAVQHRALLSCAMRRRVRCVCLVATRYPPEAGLRAR
eukprot:gene10006-biopygen1929